MNKLKLTVFRISVAVWTLVLGLLSVYLYSNISHSAQEIMFADSIDVKEQVSITEVIPASKMKTPFEFQSVFPNRFTPTFRACKPGYIQGYITDDGAALSEGSECNLENERETSSKFETKINQAKRIVERNDERIILEFEENGNHYFEILRYRGGSCIKFIHAPSLELALEFENWYESDR